MTLPDERTRALIQVKNFLRDLLDPKKTPKVPKHVRRQAGSVLRHYPFTYQIQKLYKLDPTTWGEYEDPEDTD